MSAFVLKLIAVFAMACDHFGYLIFGKFSFLNCIGRIAFPIFAYQITEGYIHTKSLKKYFLRLAIFACISQIPFMLFMTMLNRSIFSLNIFFTLLLGLLAITIFDNIYTKSDNKFYKILGFIAVILISVFASIINCDYGAFGVLAIFIFYLFKQNKLLMNISFIILVFFRYIEDIIYSTYKLQYILLAICTCLPLVFINLYNNKKGKDIKYLLYLFYPLHLLVIYALYLLIYRA